VGNERGYRDDLNTAALSDLLGVPPFVAEQIDEDVEEDEGSPSESTDGPAAT
jgi:hypothetical protein